MVRTVKVRLELDRDDYKRGLRDAANETRTFDSEVRAAGKDAAVMGVEVKSAGTEVQAMGREVDAAAKKTTDLGKETSKTREETSKTREETSRYREETDKTRAKIVDLAKEITTTKTALAEMGAEFQRTGKVNVDELDRLSRSLRELERAKAAIGKLIPGDGQQKKGGLLDEWIVKAGKAGMAAGAEAGKLFSSGLQGTLSTPVIGPLIGAAIVGGIIVATPVITSALAAAVNLGIGGGVLALGISRAVADPRVAEAWSHLADAATTSLDNASSTFVDPLVRSAHAVEEAFVTDTMPHISSAMDALAPQIEALTAGALGFLHNIGPGFDDAISAAQPFLDLLAQHLPELGSAVSSFLSHLANAGPGAQQFFHDLLTWVEGGIRALGWLVEKGAQVYQGFTALGQLITGDFKGAWETLQHIGDKGDKSFGGFHNKTIDVNVALGLLNGTISKTAVSGGLMTDRLAALSQTMGQTVVTADTLAGQMSGKLFNSMMSLDQAALGFAQSQTRVTESIKSNGLELDIHTAKGQTNIAAILGSVQANMAQYQANVAVGMSAGDAAKAYDTNTAALEDQLRAAGFTQGAIDGLIGKYRGVPDDVNTEIATKGLTEAINGINTLLRQILGLPPLKTVTVNYVTRYSTVGLPVAPRGQAQADFAMGGIRRAQVGMVIPASDPGTVLTGEPQTGGEVLIPMLGIDQGRAAMLGRTALDGYGLDVVPRGATGIANARPMTTGAGGVTRLEVVLRGEGPATQAMVSMLAKEISARGGNVQAVIGS